MNRKIRNVLWLIKLWLTTLVMFASASMTGGYIGYLAALKLTGQ